MKSNLSNHPAFILADTYIRQDAQGRFCLNDLHKAAGGEQRHRPNYWLENQQTQALIAELQTAGNPAVSEALIDELLTTQNLGRFQPLSQTQTAGIPPVSTTEGRNGGTWVCIELVYAYAMWISPAFHLQVIRTYHALMTSGRVSRQDTALARHDRLAKFAFQLVLAIERAKTNFARDTLLEHLRAAHTELGYAAPNVALLPPLPVLPSPEEKAQATVAAFWEAYQLMTAKGALLNHHRDPACIAVNLMQYLATAKDHGLPVPPRAVLLRALPTSADPAFVANKTVSSAVLNGPVHCWVFEVATTADEPQAALFMEAT